MLLKRKLLISFLLFLFISSVSYGQLNDKFWIKGKVSDSASVVKDVHVVNLNNNKGTFTNDFGDYKIVVSIGDTLQFTSVKHQTVKRIINDFIYTSEVLDIFLPIKTIELEEFELKRHDLSGFLTLDVKQTPVDRRAEALKNTMDFSNVDMTVRVDNDFIDTRVRPPKVIVDPTRKYKGLGTGFGIGGKNKKTIRLKKFVANTFTSRTIYDLCGKDFFKRIKIPDEKVFNFIDYCKKFDIEELYKKELALELVAILVREAPNFLKTLKP